MRLPGNEAALGRGSRKRQGVGVSIFLLVEQGEIVEAEAHIRMRRPERLLEDRQGSLEKRLRLAIAALTPIQEREIVEALADGEMVGPESLFADRERPAEERFSLREAAF